MSKTVAKPHAKDHYTYMNELLELPKDTLSPKLDKDVLREPVEKAKAILKELEEQQKLNAANMEIAANINKLKRVLEMLGDEGKRKSYNAALTNPVPTMELKEGAKRGTSIIPLVPIEDITKEFNAFKDEQVGKSKPGGGTYAAGDFNYEKRSGNPEVHVYTFPDKASADAFLQRLFDKNMAMFPGGSQELEATQPKPQQAIQQQAGAMEEAGSSLRALPDAGASPKPMLEAPSDDVEVDDRPRLKS